MNFETRRFDPAAYLDTDEARAEYMTAALETEDPAFIADALGVIARARGMAKVAGEARLSREHLYRSLSENGNPELATVLKVMRALHLRLQAVPAEPAATAAATPSPPTGPWRRSGRPASPAPRRPCRRASAWSAVSIFIASIDSSTSPALTAWPGLDRRPSRSTPGIGAPTCVVVALLRLGAHLRRRRPPSGSGTRDDARLAVEVEEDADLALLVGLADGLQIADHQRLAALDLDRRSPRPASCRRR